MLRGFIRVATAAPEIRTADVAFNKEEVLKCMQEAEKQGCDITVFPELVLTGAACGDLFLMDSLIRASRKALDALAEKTKEISGLFFIGLPIRMKGTLYNGLAGINGGEILGVTVKNTADPRYFSPCAKENWSEVISYGSSTMYESFNAGEIIVGAEIGTDALSLFSPGMQAAQRGASIIVNAAAFPMDVSEKDLEKTLSAYSKRLHAGYVLANGNPGDSTTDAAYEGKGYIFEDGERVEVKESRLVVTDLSLETLVSARDRDASFHVERENGLYHMVDFEEREDVLLRTFEKLPFVGSDAESRRVFDIQTAGLKKRLQHVKAKSSVIGISGGLDSTLALLVMCRAFDELLLDRKDIIAVTMPCFGTTDRTYTNACLMAEKLGVTLREISIKDAVLSHFKDIDHDPEDRNVAFENAQARERTQVLMDIANDCGGFVVGTGDMSELALGWATYNGDQMSMYGVNAGVPKTAIRAVTTCIANNVKDPELGKILLDVVETPVSPELLPPKEGQIEQKTEDLVGPYELHDFFLYHFIGKGLTPGSVYRMAVKTFEGTFTGDVIYKWLRTFIWRFFTQQYKRSAMPDGPQVYGFSLSPRGALNMPSDAQASVWISDLEDAVKEK